MKWLLHFLLVTLLMLALVAGATVWLITTQSGLRALVAVGEWTFGERLIVTDARGTLNGTLHVGRVAYAAEGTTIELTDLEVESHLASLLQRMLVIEHLDVAHIVVRQGASQAQPARSPTLPVSLALPLEVRVDGALVRSIEIVRPDATSVQVRNLVAVYTGGRSGHALRTLRAETDFGTVGGAGTIGAASPFPLDIGLAYLHAGTRTGAGAPPAPPAAWPIVARAHLFGSLRETRTAAHVDVAGTQATARATVTPFDRPWPELLRALQVDARGVDLARLFAGLPRTDLTLQADARGTGNDLRGALTLRNGAPGPVDRARVPVSSLALAFVTDLASLQLERVAIDLAPHGTLRGTATMQREPLTARLDLRAEQIDLSALRSGLRATALGGPLQIEIDGPQRQVVRATLAQDDIQLGALARRDGERVDITDLKLAARGGSATGYGNVRLGDRLRFDASLNFRRFDPARFGEFPAGDINGNAQANGELGPPRRIAARWHVTPSRLRGQQFTSTGTVRVTGERVGNVDATAQLGANTIVVGGAFGGAADRLQWRLDAPMLAQLADGLGGQLNAAGTLRGTGERMQADVTATGKQLRLPSNISIATVRLQGRAGLQADAPLEIALKAQRIALPQQIIDTATFDTTGTRAQHTANLRAAAGRQSLELQLRGGWSGSWPGEWAGELTSAQARAEEPVRVQAALAAPAPITLSAQRVSVTAMRLVLTGDAPEAQLQVAELIWQPEALRTSGHFEHLSTQWIAAVTPLPSGVDTTVAFGGEWNVRAQPRLDGTLSIVRESGDVRLAGPPAIEAGLSNATLRARFEAGNVTAELGVDSKLATMRAQANVGAVAAAPGLGLTPDSPLGFAAQLDITELRLISEPLQTLARVSGRLVANLKGNGTLGAPRADGTLTGDALAIDAPPYGVQLDQGRLRMELHGEQVQVNEFALRGGDGRFSADGTLSLRPGAPASVRWRAENFRLLNRPDMRLVLTGGGNAGVIDGRFGLQGDLHVERGHFEMAFKKLPRPGEDVDVIGEEPPPERGAARAPLNLDLRADLGKALTVRAAGFDGKATGNVHLTTTPEGELRVAGRVQAADGKFRAYGQQLVVDPGVLVFDGPVDNPTLQITAWRRNQQIEAGVQLSGTAQAPQVTLVSQPEVAQGDRLAWLVLGHGPSSAGGADLGLLQGAAGAFLGGSSDAVPFNQKIANSLGLDELAVRSSSEIETNVVAVGKRLSDKLLVTYEHGLGTAAENLVRLDYALTRRLSVRAETGSSTGLGMFYRFAWD